MVANAFTTVCQLFYAQSKNGRKVTIKMAIFANVTLRFEIKKGDQNFGPFLTLCLFIMINFVPMILYST